MPTRALTSLCDWHPDNLDGLSQDDWLSRWRAAGWVPMFAAPYAGVWVEVGGVYRQRWAMVKADVAPFTLAGRVADTDVSTRARGGFTR